MNASGDEGTRARPVKLQRSGFRGMYAPDPSPGPFVEASMRTLRVVLVSVLIAAASAASAQPAPSSDALRARYERMRDHPPATASEGALHTVEFLTWLAGSLDGTFADKAPLYRRRAERYLDAMEAGRDPFDAEKGRIANRGYHSLASVIPQGYAIYVPADYDPSRAYPLYVALHGGSSNGNLFLGVVLGNNMDWLTYDQHLWDEFTPRWKPDWIVVAPTGFGQMLWRWQGEQDVLDVIADVQRNYHVDPDQIVLGGLSNGGLGAYAVGNRHAYRFSTVMAMAGAPSWMQYAPCQCSGLDRANVLRWSGLHLIENSMNTDWRTYHGRTDTGPMRPQFINVLEERVRELHLPARITWYDTGHDILYLCHERGNIYSRLAPVKRNPHPREVRLVTGDYRAARQHWLTVTRITSYPELARLRGVVDGNTVTIETSNTTAFTVDLRDVPIEGDELKIVVDGNEAYSGARGPLGHVASFVADEGRFVVGYPEDPSDSPVKRPGLSGPITDAYYGRMIHVYGTGNADQRDALRAAAERGARGWVLWSWHMRQEVVADTDVTDAMIAGAHLVIYGTPGANSVLERIADRLPIRVDATSVRVGAAQYTTPGVGVRFIYPSPLAPNRYVIVQAAPTVEAVAAGNTIPEFLPDYFVYDRNTSRRARAQARHAGPNATPVATGFFDERWQLRTTTAALEVDDDEEAPSAIPPAPLPTQAVVAAAPTTNAAPASVQVQAPQRQPMTGDDSRGGRSRGPLPIPPAPPVPARPTRFLAAEGTQEGTAARMIADRIQQFHNYRAHIRGATWTNDTAGVWSIRPASDCLAELDRLQIPYQRSTRLNPQLVPTPVQIGGEIRGVRFQMAAANRPFVIACELAARLPIMADALRPLGVNRVGVVSAYRDNPFTSFHTMGLALDIGSFGMADGRTVRVLGQFRMTPDEETCAAAEPSAPPNARDLYRIACALARTHVFASVLTPNYNEGHHDHFHVDVRPDDPRFFLR